MQIMCKRLEIWQRKQREAFNPSVVPMGGFPGGKFHQRGLLVKPGMEGQLPFDHRLHKDRMEKVILHFHGLQRAFKDRRGKIQRYRPSFNRASLTSHTSTEMKATNKTGIVIKNDVGEHLPGPPTTASMRDTEQRANGSTPQNIDVAELQNEFQKLKREQHYLLESIAKQRVEAHVKIKRRSSEKHVPWRKTNACARL